MTEKFDSLTAFAKRVLEISSKEKTFNRKSYAIVCWLEDNIIDLSGISSSTPRGEFLLTCTSSSVLSFDEEGLLNRSALA